MRVFFCQENLNYWFRKYTVRTLEITLNYANIVINNIVKRKYNN